MGWLFLLYDIGQWKVPKANAKKFLVMMSRFVEWQRRNRKKFHYTHSSYGIVRDEDKSAETWMYIDEYEDQESYDKFVESFQTGSPENAGFLKLKEEFESLIVPDSYKCARVIMKQELRVV